ncbi:MAG: DUF3108 domain-containing protein [Pseudoxanthomonas sp.]
MNPVFNRFALAALLAAAALPARALEPFSASYQAYNEGKLVGVAKMRVAPTEGELWRIDLDIKADRGFAGLIGLNIDQSTVFSVNNNDFRPLGQSTVKHAFFRNKKATGSYDWKALSARWEGDISDKRTAPVPLQPGDLSTLLLNLAVIRDAEPGKQLSYRVVDNGRAREHRYAVAAETEIVAVEDLSYDAMRVQRSNGGNDETLFWVANGVPTPVRILQRKDGRDGIDLRLVEYEEVQ